MVRFAGAELGAETDCDAFRMPAHLAFCANAIFRREAADTLRVFWVVSTVVRVPFKNSIPEIISFNFSSRNCVALRSLRSS
jgi:hypothetical protein